jgi:hypothetical protein
MRSINLKYGRLLICIFLMKSSRMANGGVDIQIPSGDSGDGAFISANHVS